MEPDKFCARLIAGMHVAHGECYSAQNFASCLGIYNLCQQASPDWVVDVGTAYGASALVCALALVHMGRSPACLTTIDFQHVGWEHSLGLHAELLAESGVEAHEIQTVTRSFTQVPARDILQGRERLFLFYDIHDSIDDVPSATLFQGWVPLIQSGLVAVHDCVVASYEGQAIQTARHHEGQLFAGYPECARTINWLNEYKASVGVAPQVNAIYFEVRDGVPVHEDY